MEILSIRGQGKVMIGDYMLYTLYEKICLTTYQKHTNPAKNPYYPTGSEKSARKSIKDTWDRGQFKFFTRDNFQHTAKKKIIAAVSPEFIEEGNNQKKGFAGISDHDLMEYLMVWYGSTTKPTKDQSKAEFREDYDPRFPI